MQYDDTVSLTRFILVSNNRSIQVVQAIGLAGRSVVPVHHHAGASVPFTGRPCSNERFRVVCVATHVEPHRRVWPGLQHVPNRVGDDRLLVPCRNEHSDAPRELYTLYLARGDVVGLACPRMRSQR